MTTAAVAAVLDGLPDIPCMAPVPHPNRTVPDMYGERIVRRCVLRNGHGEYEIPCHYEWHTEQITLAVADQDEEF